jgi:hypothetical protein
MLDCHLLQIVAGLEPENTNLFLQMLGTAARMGPAADAVQVGTQDTARHDMQVSANMHMLQRATKRLLCLLASLCCVVAALQTTLRLHVCCRGCWQEEGR